MKFTGFGDAVRLQDTNITIQNSTFLNNDAGVQVDSSGNSIGYNPAIGMVPTNKGNVFTGNEIAVQIGETGSKLAGATINASGNSVAGNAIDGSTVSSKGLAGLRRARR